MPTSVQLLVTIYYTSNHDVHSPFTNTVILIHWQQTNPKPFHNYYITAIVYKYYLVVPDILHLYIRLIFGGVNVEIFCHITIPLRWASKKYIKNITTKQWLVQISISNKESFYKELRDFVQNHYYSVLVLPAQLNECKHGTR